MLSRLMLVAVLAAVLAGCSPASTRAVRLTEAGMPQILDNSCESRKLTQVVIQGSNGDQVLDERDPVVWQIDFAEPRQHYTITVGQVPEGAVETVAWQSPPGSELLTVSLFNGDLWEPGLDFTLDQLKDGRVMYLYRTFTAEQFEKERVSC